MANSDVINYINSYRSTSDESVKKEACKFIFNIKTFDLQTFDSNIDNLIKILYDVIFNLKTTMETRLCWRFISQYFHFGRSKILYKKMIESGILREFVPYASTTLDNIIQHGLTQAKLFVLLNLLNNFIETCFLESINYLSIDIFQTYVQITIQLSALSKKTKGLKDFIKNLIDNNQYPQQLQQLIQAQTQTQTQTPQQQMQLYLQQSEELIKKITSPITYLSDSLKNDHVNFFNVTLNGNSDSMAMVCQELLNVYEIGIEQSSAPLLNVNGTLRNILQEHPQIQNKVNFESAFKKTLSSFLSNSTEFIQFFKKDKFDTDLKSNIQQKDRVSKLFKYYFKVVNYFIQCFSPRFNKDLISFSLLAMIDILAELPPNNRIKESEYTKSNLTDIIVFVQTLLDSLILSNSNNPLWLDRIIEIIIEKSPTPVAVLGSNNINNNSINMKQRFGQFKLVLMLFEVHSNSITNNIRLVELFRNSIGNLGYFITDIYQTPQFNQFLVKSYHQLVIKSTITQSVEFFNYLLSSLYYSNIIIQNFLIDIWFIIIKNSNESFQNWNLKLIIRNIIKFNSRYEIIDFINVLSLLLKRVFGILGSDQKDIIYNDLVGNFLINNDQYEDNVRTLPISIGVFFNIIGGYELPSSLNQLIQTKVIPFLITKLNQPNIYSTPNLMENILLLLSKVKKIESIEMSQLLNDISILILGSISDSNELKKLFENSFIIPYLIEIITNNINTLSATKLNSLLPICSNLSSLPISKQSMCKLLASIGNSSIINQYLYDKLDQGLVIQSFKTIYQNLFKSATLLLYINIESSLKHRVPNSFILFHKSQIIPTEETSKINNYLKSIPQPIDVIPMSDDDRFNEQLKTIKLFDTFKKNNLKERYSLITTQQYINISSIFPINLPKQQPIAPISMNGNYSNGNNNNNNNNNNSVDLVLSKGKFVDVNRPLSKDDYASGLNTVVEGLDKIEKLTKLGIKMDRVEMDRFRERFTKVGQRFLSLHDSLF